MRISLPRIGLGGAPLGNMFHPLSEATADATLQAAWDAGFRYYDVSPHYGAGLAEQRFGRLLSGKPRDEFVLSTKVGRLLQPASAPENAKPFVDELPNKRVPDYSADGARRSIEDSLERLGVDRLDVVFIHDVFLLAGRYSLLDHREALETLFPRCLERGVGIVVGGPFNSGVLAGGDHFEYDRIPDEIRDRKARLDQVAQRFGVDLRAAAIHFCLAHPAVLSTIPGTANPARPAQYMGYYQARVPAEFWQALKHEGLLGEDVPVPA
ncbi:aldo/keto reductase [Pseudomonas sp. S5(2021)]|nr:aldo/keto reductase [Pseudomonas sp. S5(2021)]